MLVKLSGCGLAATHWMEGGGARPLCRQLSIDIAKDRTYFHQVATQMPHICIYHTHICTYVYIYNYTYIIYIYIYVYILVGWCPHFHEVSASQFHRSTPFPFKVGVHTTKPKAKMVLIKGPSCSATTTNGIYTQVDQLT